jgi:transposase
MEHLTQFTVGIDLHQDTVSLAVLEGWRGDFSDVRTLPNDLVKLKRFFGRLTRRGEVRACYEAGGCGYVLQRRLESWGVRCEVIAPSLIPRRSGDRRKTDRRDACKLAKLYRAGELTAIRVPSEADERVRSLLRCRWVFTRELLKSRHYVLKLLQSRDRVYRRGNNWTRAHWDWLRQLELVGEDHFVLQNYLALLEVKLAQREEIDRRIEKISRIEPYAESVARLRCMRGIDTLSAMTLVVEIGDIRRFATPRHLMGYLGLTVSEYSSGSGPQTMGGITKAGNAHCRRVLVEAAWHYRRAPRMSRALRQRQAGRSPDVVAHAWRAQRRLYKRYRSLSIRKPSTVAVVAVARELSGFVWALLSGRPDALLAA